MGLSRRNGCSASSWSCWWNRTGGRIAIRWDRRPGDRIIPCVGIRLISILLIPWVSVELVAIAPAILRRQSRQYLYATLRYLPTTALAELAAPLLPLAAVVVLIPAVFSLPGGRAAAAGIDCIRQQCEQKRENHIAKRE